MGVHVDALPVGERGGRCFDGETTSHKVALAVASTGPEGVPWERLGSCWIFMHGPAIKELNTAVHWKQRRDQVPPLRRGIRSNIAARNLFHIV